MHEQLFTLGSIAEMDHGRIKEAFEQKMRECVSDCEDRPTVKGARKLTLTAEFTPETDGKSLETVNIAFDFKVTLPKFKTRSYSMETDGRGSLIAGLIPAQRLEDSNAS